MSKETRIWTMNKNGNIVFHTINDVNRAHYKSANIFEHPAVAYAVMLLCAVIDCTLFYQLLSKVLYDDPMIRCVITFSLLIGFDFAPCYLGLKIREASQGYKINRFICSMLAIAFILAFMSNFYIRIVMRDLACPDFSSAPSLMGSVMTEDRSSPFSTAFAVFSAILPAVTSLSSFGISYSITNPLRNELEELEKETLQLEADLIQTRAILKEYEADADYYERIKADDEERYRICLERTCENAMRYSDYVRERIKEFLKDDPSGVNELSKEQYDHLIKLLSNNSSAIISKKALYSCIEQEIDETREFIA